MQFTLNGAPVELTREQVERRLVGVEPEPVRAHGVRVGNAVYPVKQAFEIVAGIARTEFTSHTARRHLLALGLEVVSASAGATESVNPESLRAPTSDDPRGWPWEGAVQALFGDYLLEHAWTVTAMADTVSKARGVDLLARKEDRRLGAEVKGWPSAGYADARRANEVKRTRPTTQAGHWFSQALCKAIMLLDSHPGCESLVVLPDYPRYRDLADRTRSGREAARVHVVFVSSHGRVESSTWTP